jgi:hypothetical protein
MIQERLARRPSRLRKLAASGAVPMRTKLGRWSLGMGAAAVMSIALTVPIASSASAATTKPSDPGTSSPSAASVVQLVAKFELAQTVPSAECPTAVQPAEIPPECLAELPVPLWASACPVGGPNLAALCSFGSTYPNPAVARGIAALDCANAAQFYNKWAPQDVQLDERVYAIYGKEGLPEILTFLPQGTASCLPVTSTFLGVNQPALEESELVIS